LQDISSIEHIISEALFCTIYKIQEMSIIEHIITRNFIRYYQ